jgi:O-antigen/teichoic acid export membrane protein
VTPSPAQRDSRDITRGAGFNYLGFAARLGSRAPFLVLAGLLYGEAVFGRYTFALAVIETAAALSLFGVKRSMLKFMSRAQATGGSLPQAIGNAVALPIIAAMVMTVAVAGGAAELATLFNSPSVAEALLLLAPAIPLIVTADVLLAAIRFTRDMRPEVLSRSVAEPLTLTLVLVAAYLGGVRETGLFVAYLASVAMAAGGAVFFFVRRFPVRECLAVRLHWRDMRELVGYSGPTAFFDLLILLSNRVDVYLVTFFFPDAVLGVYGMAWQFSSFVKKIRAGFDPIVAPVVSQSLADGDVARAEGQLAMVSRWVLTVQVPVVLAFAFLGDELLGLMGGGFAGGALILTILVLGDMINGTAGFSEYPFLFERPAANVGFGALQLSANVALGIVLIGFLGPEGAALGVLGSYALVNAIRLVALSRAFGIGMLRAAMVKPLVAGAVAGGVLWVLDRLLPGEVVVRVAASMGAMVAAYVLVLVGLGLEREERELVGGWKGRRKGEGGRVG